MPRPDLSDNPFTDLVGHWAVEDVLKLRSAGIVNGVTATTFEPERSITRAEVATLVFKTLKLSESNFAAIFDDVKAADWYGRMVVTLYNRNIINPNLIDANMFLPGAPMLREEIISLIAEAYRFKTYNKAVDIKTNEFKDANQAAAWVIDDVNLLYTLGIVKGSGTGELLPKDNVTRAECAALIYRLNSTQ